MSPESYRLDEARFVQEAILTSAADALSLLAASANYVVPSGKVRTILAVSYAPSAVETRNIVLYVLTGSGLSIVIWGAQSFVFDGLTLGLSFIPIGSDIKLFPGDKLIVQRSAAAAGSTMTQKMRWIDSDLPYTKYVEPQREISRSRRSVFPLLSPLGTARAAAGGHEAEGPPPAGKGEEPA